MNWKFNHTTSNIKNPEKVTIRKDTLMIFLISIIAFFLAYLVYTKYEERRQMQQAIEYTEKLMGTALKTANESQKQINKTFSNMHQNIQTNIENQKLKTQINQLNHKINNYKIDNYYQKKKEEDEKSKAIIDLKKQLKGNNNVKN